MEPEIIAALIGPLITAGLAAFAVGFQEWRRRRQSLGQRQDALDQALREVTFIDAWITAHGKAAAQAGIQSRASRALGDLDRAYEVVAILHAAAAVEPRPRNGVDRLRSLLLLNVQRTPAKVLRVLYLILLVSGCLFTTIGMNQGLDTIEGGVYLNILVAMFFTLFSFTPAIAVYWLARLFDRPQRDRAQPAVTPPLDPRGMGYPPPQPQFGPHPQFGQFTPQAPPSQAPVYPPPR